MWIKFPKMPLKVSKIGIRIRYTAPVWDLTSVPWFYYSSNPYEVQYFTLNNYLWGNVHLDSIENHFLDCPGISVVFPIMYRVSFLYNLFSRLRLHNKDLFFPFRGQERFLSHIFFANFPVAIGNSPQLTFHNRFYSNFSIKEGGITTLTADGRSVNLIGTFVTQL